MTSTLNHFVKDLTFLNVIISSMMNLLVFVTIIGLTQGFPTILDIDNMPCNSEALEVRIIWIFAPKNISILLNENSDIWR